MSKDSDPFYPKLVINISFLIGLKFEYIFHYQDF